MLEAFVPLGSVGTGEADTVVCCAVGDPGPACAFMLSPQWAMAYKTSSRRSMDSECSMMGLLCSNSCPDAAIAMRYAYQLAPRHMHASLGGAE